MEVYKNVHVFSFVGYLFKTIFANVNIYENKAFSNAHGNMNLVGHMI